LSVFVIGLSLACLPGSIPPVHWLSGLWVSPSVCLAWVINNYQSPGPSITGSSTIGSIGSVSLGSPIITNNHWPVRPSSSNFLRLGLALGLRLGHYRSLSNHWVRPVCHSIIGLSVYCLNSLAFITTGPSIIQYRLGSSSAWATGLSGSILGWARAWPGLLAQQ